MRFFLGSLLLAVLCGLVSAEAEHNQLEAEAEEGTFAAEEGYESEILAEAPVHYRQKRATCDLLSAWGVGHTACAGHCIAKGYKGGYCNSRQVCNCRR